MNEQQKKSVNKTDLLKKNFITTNILIYGLGQSGYETAKILKKYGTSHIDVTFKDNNISKETQRKVDELQQLGINVYPNYVPQEILQNSNLMIKNPGIPTHDPLIESFKQQSPITTEIELAYAISPAPIIAITGTNGKTTTTTLIGEMFNQGRYDTKVAGNIGYVACKAADEITEDQILILEVSSFQLELVQSFKPHIAVITNLDSAHLDHHKNLVAYHEAKKNIYRAQNKDDFIILNGRQLDMFDLSTIQSTIIPFYTDDKIKKGIWVEHDKIVFEGEVVCDVTEILVPGKHNLENVLAAIAVAKLCDVNNEDIIHVLHQFKGVAHRLEYVGKYEGVTYYNDSKSTNHIATQTALTALQEHPVILLCGGYDRKEDNKELIPYFKNLSAIICYGANKLTMIQRSEEAGVKRIYEVNNLEEAVKIAAKIAVENDIVLLSPASASWDQYSRFEERGEAFKTFIQNKVGK